jgi:uncharacterized protein
MNNTLLRSPGVRIREVVIEPAPVTPTGVPGFVGFARPKSPADAASRVVVLQNANAFATHFDADADGYLADAVAAFFDNGGTLCHVAWADPRERTETALATALDHLRAVDEPDLVAMPDAMALRASADEIDRDAALRLQQRVIAHCAERGDRFAILDALPGSAAQTVLAQRERIARGADEPVNAALYWPWPKAATQRLLPPCGHVAGVYARRDVQAGSFRAPANEELFGVLDLEQVVGDTVQDVLAPEGVNCLRALPGRGIRVWGARTLSRDPAWRHVNVRRMVIELKRWIDRALAATTFEPNGPALWVRIRRELEAHLDELWRAGALQGETPALAYFVQCDEQNNPIERRDAGELVVEIGLAPTVPAEFVLVRLIRRPGSREFETVE